MIQLLLTVGLVVACGDDEAYKTTTKKKQEIEVIDHTKNSDDDDDKSTEWQKWRESEEQKQRDQDYEDRHIIAKEKEDERREEAILSRWRAEQEEILDRVRGNQGTVLERYHVYCVFTDLNTPSCVACVDDERPSDSLALCNEGMKELEHGGKCYETLNQCFIALGN